MSARSSGLVLALAAGLAAAPVHAARMKRAMVIPLRTTGAKGEVRYVSSTLAYLDRGSADGLTLGRELSFTRAGRPVGTCQVDVLDTHFATCVTDKLRKGDRFSFARVAEPPMPSAPPPLASLETLARRRGVVTGAPQQLVDFEARADVEALHRVAVALGQAGFGNFGGTGGPFGVTRLDAAVYDVDLFHGLRASADLSVVSSGAKDLPWRAPTASTATVFLRQLELGFHRADVPFSAAVGRVWLRGTPGLLVVDGAQAAFRVDDGLELGAYGGLMPESLGLGLALDQVAAGAFARLRTVSGKGAEAFVAQADVRAGYAVRTSLGARFELGVAGHLYGGKAVDAHLSADLGFGGTAQAPGGLDAARVDVGWRPSEALSVALDARYRGLMPTGVVELGTVSPGARAVHADGTASWQPSPAVRLSLTGGGAVDLDGGLTQARVGPQVDFPTVFGRFGGLSFSYAEELGWLRGRSASGQVTLLGLGLVRLVSRTTWFQQDASGDLVNDLGESVHLEVRPTRWLWVRASVSGRLALGTPPDDGAAAVPTAGVASLQVGGTL